MAATLREIVNAIFYQNRTGYQVRRHIYAGTSRGQPGQEARQAR
jgi:hypothetical protein